MCFPINKQQEDLDTIESLKNELAAVRLQQQQNEGKYLRYQTIFENSCTGIKILNADLKILEVNQALVDLLGYSSKYDIVGSKITHFAPDERHSDWSYFQDMLQSKTPSFNFETKLRKKEGAIISCFVTSILFPHNGDTLSYTSIVDITEQDNLKKQKEEFISVASHELRNPVATLQGALQVIKMIVSSGTKDQLLPKMLDAAERSAFKLNFLIRDLYDLTQIEGRQLQLDKSSFSMENAIKSCSIHIDMDERKTLLYTGDHSLTVFADRDKIDQVLVNLVNNAVLYAPACHEIVVDVQKVKWATKVSVIDKGPGIPKDKLPFLFDKYFSVDKSRNNGSGFGLGLYISHEIIKRHGGEMGVDSVLGQGATFWFTIPDQF